MKSRKERKLEAKQNGVKFVPQYNGTGVVSFEDYYGVGNERFNNKFVQFLNPVEDVEDIRMSKEEIDVTIKTHGLINIEANETISKERNGIEVIEAEAIVEAPKKKKNGKFKKALKKLFNK